MEKRSRRVTTLIDDDDGDESDYSGEGTETEEEVDETLFVESSTEEEEDEEEEEDHGHGDSIEAGKMEGLPEDEDFGGDDDDVEIIFGTPRSPKRASKVPVLSPNWEDLGSASEDEKYTSPPASSKEAATKSSLASWAAKSPASGAAPGTLKVDGFPDDILPHFRPVALLERLALIGLEAMPFKYSSQFNGAACQVERKQVGVKRTPKSLEEFAASRKPGGFGTASTPSTSAFTGTEVAVWKVTGVKGGASSKGNLVALQAIRGALLKRGTRKKKGRGKKGKGKAATRSSTGGDDEFLEKGKAMVRQYIDTGWKDKIWIGEAPEIPARLEGTKGTTTTTKNCGSSSMMSGNLGGAVSRMFAAEGGKKDTTIGSSSYLGAVKVGVGPTQGLVLKSSTHSAFSSASAGVPCLEKGGRAEMGGLPPTKVLPVSIPIARHSKGRGAAATAASLGLKPLSFKAPQITSLPLPVPKSSVPGKPLPSHVMNNLIPPPPPPPFPSKANAPLKNPFAVGSKY